MIIDFDDAEQTARDPLFSLRPGDTYMEMLADHLYGEHGINTRGGATLRDVEERHAADHAAETHESDRPDSWMEHEPDEFYVGRWMRAVPATNPAGA